MEGIDYLHKKGKFAESTAQRFSSSSAGSRFAPMM